MKKMRLFFNTIFMSLSIFSLCSAMVKKDVQVVISEARDSLKRQTFDFSQLFNDVKTALDSKIGKQRAFYKKIKKKLGDNFNKTEEQWNKSIISGDLKLFEGLWFDIIKVKAEDILKQEHCDILVLNKVVDELIEKAKTVFNKEPYLQISQQMKTLFDGDDILIKTLKSRFEDEKVASQLVAYKSQSQAIVEAENQLAVVQQLVMQVRDLATGQYAVKDKAGAARLDRLKAAKANLDKQFKDIVGKIE